MFFRWFSRDFWIGAAEFGPGLLGRKHPVDSGALGVAAFFPGCGLSDETSMAVDPSVEALLREDADFDLDHVEPAGVLWRVMEFETAEQAASFVGRECLIECAGLVGRQIVEHNANAFGFGIVHVDKLAHAFGKVLRGASFRHLHLAPGPVHVNEHEQVGRAVASVLVIVTLDPARLGGNRLTGLADELDLALVEADHRPLRIGRLGLQLRETNMKTVVVRYKVKPEKAEENQRLIQEVFAELGAKAPVGLQYLVLRLEDDSFVHLASVADNAPQLATFSTFQRFRRDAEARRLTAPESHSATIIGNYPSGDRSSP